MGRYDDPNAVDFASCQGHHRPSAVPQPCLAAATGAQPSGSNWIPAKRQQLETRQTAETGALRSRIGRVLGRVDRNLPATRTAASTPATADEASMCLSQSPTHHQARHGECTPKLPTAIRFGHHRRLADRSRLSRFRCDQPCRNPSPPPPPSRRPAHPTVAKRAPASRPAASPVRNRPAPPRPTRSVSAEPASTTCGRSTSTCPITRSR